MHARARKVSRHDNRRAALIQFISRACTSGLNARAALRIYMRGESPEICLRLRTSDDSPLLPPLFPRRPYGACISLRMRPLNKIVARARANSRPACARKMDREDERDASRRDFPCREVSECRKHREKHRADTAMEPRSSLPAIEHGARLAAIIAPCLPLRRRTRLASSH